MPRIKPVQDEGITISTKIHSLADTGVFGVMASQSSTAVTTASVATSGGTKDFITGDGECTILLFTGTCTGTSPTVAVSVQESTDGTTWTGVTGTFTSGTTMSCSASSSFAATGCGFERSKRYLQPVFTTSGTTAVMATGAIIIEQKKVLL